MEQEMETWIYKKGIDFLLDIGVKKNYHLLDFGCRYGTYTIPAASIVGKKGKIYAVDKDKEALTQLQKKIKRYKLKNINPILSDESAPFFFNHSSLDMILLYDIIHMIDHPKKLIAGFHQLLKPDKILSVYPKHHETHMKKNLREIITYIEEIGFQLDTKQFTKLMHDDQFEYDYILNFKKLVK